jgi:secreted trypsin-like serine protease
MIARPAKRGAIFAALCLALLLGAAPGPIASGAAAAPEPSAHASVVGGKPAAPGEFPWMAFVVDVTGAETATVCSGTVLAPRVVLTAAHCVLDEHSGALNEVAGYRVVTGTVNWTFPERQVSEVSRLIPYPRFGKARDGFGDAALLVLATPTTAPSIPVATHANARLLRIGHHAVIAGWGQTYFDQEEPTESLMWAKTLVGSDRCEGLWGRICAIDFPRASSGACHGDSGGPLVAASRKSGWIEIGITEAGFGRCTTRRPQLFTRTDLIAKWIKGRIAQIEAQAAPPA